MEIRGKSKTAPLPDTPKAKRNSMAFSYYLYMHGYPKRGLAVKKCSRNVTFSKPIVPPPQKSYFSLVTPLPCGQWRLCQVCAIRRMGRYLAKLKPHCDRLLDEGYAFSFCTLTITNHADLRLVFDMLISAIRDMLNHRRRNLKSQRYPPIEFSKALGGIITVEVKKGRDGTKWHPHLHILLVHKRGIKIDDWALSKEWLNFTKGAGKIVKTKPVLFTHKSITECIKYPIKFGGMKQAEILHAFEVLRGERMITTFGLLRGIQPPAIDPPTDTVDDGVLDWDGDEPDPDDLEPDDWEAIAERQEEIEREIQEQEYLDWEADGWEPDEPPPFEVLRPDGNPFLTLRFGWKNHTYTVEHANIEFRDGRPRHTHPLRSIASYLATGAIA